MLSRVIAFSATLDQTSVGRFGVGHKITANSASQNLLTWNVVNTGRDIEVRLYDPDGNPLSLGRCGLPLEPKQEVHNDICEIGWTQLTSRYTTAHASLDVHESLLTPALWLRSNSANLSLFQPPLSPQSPLQKGVEVQTLALPLRGGVAVVAPRNGYERTKNGPLARPWFLALVRQGEYRFPIICLLHRAPKSIRMLPSGGLSISWQGGGADHTVGLLPLFGCRPIPLPSPTQPGSLTSAWERRLPSAVERKIDLLASWFLHLPVGMQETYRLTSNAVQIIDALRFRDLMDDWGWSRRMRGYALAPPALVNARRFGYPVHFARPTTDLDYPMFLSPLQAIRNTSVLTYSLPRPDIYRTIYSPSIDPALKKVLPDAVTRTVRDYSDYVVQTYQAKPHASDENSAIGEARSFASEYPCSRLMTPQARQAFDRWANWAATRLYARNTCYGYGVEVANNRRFLLDNYRIGGKDYIDAGWFGYDIMAMWARAHYAGRWDEVRRNWSWIKELFYGWNWSYSDYASMYSPLYVDGANGGNPKGYTDNMSMLPAHYAWARMADRMGDRVMLNDALYMLARDRAARFNRMTLYDYTRSCGFHTDVNFLTSDLWDGPNIAPSSRYIPPDPGKLHTGTVVDYGNNAVGLWFLSGSFLEPSVPETVDLILTGDMKRHVVATEAMIDRRFPRWWASPGAGEPANYQIYLRGALFHEDPERLRYYFDYADSFRQGVWYADAWHADAFAGILLSSFHGLEYRDDVEILRKAGGVWRPVTSEVEFNLLLDRSNRRFLTLWNTTNAPLEVQIRLRKHADAALHITLLRPGSNVLALNPTAVIPHGVEARGPARIVAVVGTKHDVSITLTNHGSVARTCRIEAHGFSIEGGMSHETLVRPGRSVVLNGSCLAPNDCRAPYNVSYTLKTGGGREEHRIEVLTLPATVALLDLEGSRVIRMPDLGTAHLIAHNRTGKAIPLQLSWSLNGKEVGQKLLPLDGGKGTEWSIPLQVNDVPPGRYTLTVALQGSGIAPQNLVSNLVLLPKKGAGSASQSVLLYGFERDTEGWNMPDWPDANKDAQGKVSQPVCSTNQADEGRQSLTAMFRLASGQMSQGYVGVRPLSDWRPFRRVLADVYLPSTAPEGLVAQFYMMEDGWHWRQGKQTTALKPGRWTTVEADLAGPAAAAYWTCPEGDLQAGLANVMDFGLRLGNQAPIWVGYQGPVYVDNFRAEAE